MKLTSHPRLDLKWQMIILAVGSARALLQGILCRGVDSGGFGGSLNWAQRRCDHTTSPAELARGQNSVQTAEREGIA